MFPIYTHRKYIRMERPKIVRDKCTRVVLKFSRGNHVIGRKSCPFLFLILDCCPIESNRTKKSVQSCSIGNKIVPIDTHRKYARMERPKIVRDKCTRVILNNSSTNHCADVKNVRLSTSKLKNKLKNEGKLSCQHPTRNPLPTSALTRSPQRSTW